VGWGGWALFIYQVMRTFRLAALSEAAATTAHRPRRLDRFSRHFQLRSTDLIPTLAALGWAT
jgi:hypothetical protein